MNRESIRVMRNGALLGRVGLLMAVLLTVVGFVGLQRALAVTPGLYEVEGNPSCENLYQVTVISGPASDLLELGPLFGFKYDANPVDDASSTLTDNAPWKVTGGPQDLFNTVSIFNVMLDGGEGIQFDWSATLGIDAVIVKAQDANAYVYSPEAFGSTGLQAPDAKAVSHIEFCYDYELDVSKDVHTSFTRTYDWDISKTADEDYIGFAGDKFTHNYTITVNQTGYTDNQWAVDGAIRVENNTPLDATITSISDVIDAYGDVDSLGCGVSFPYILPAGETLDCSYSAGPVDSPNQNPFGDTNTATVTTDTTVSPVGGTEATAEVIFSPTASAVTEVYATVNVTDDNGTDGDGDDRSFGPLTDGESVHYSRDFICPSDVNAYTDGKYAPGTWNNTATIDETGAQDDANVNLSCFIPSISKTAAGTYDERHEWEVEKSVHPIAQSAFAGDTVTFNWHITVDETIFEENFDVAGTITVDNPSPENALEVSLVDMVDGHQAIIDEASCDYDTATGKLTVAKGSSETCHYTASDLPYTALAQAPTANTATISFNGIELSASDPIEYTANVIRGTATLDDDRHPFAGDPVNDDTQFTYEDTYTCSSALADYTDGAQLDNEVSNTARVYADDELQDTSAATTNIDCYIPVLSKTAAGSYIEDHDWTISKSVSPTPQDQFAGLGVDFTWAIVVQETVEEYGFGVSGDITLQNPAPMPMTVNLVDVLDDDARTEGVIDACNNGVEYAAGMLTIPANTTTVCGYSASPGGRTATENTATATMNGIAFTASDEIGWSPTVLDASVTIDDHQKPDEFPIIISDSRTFTYADSYTCSSDPTEYGDDGVYKHTEENVATLATDDDQIESSAATEVVTCYAPVLSKTAQATYDERHDWRVVKTVTDPVGPFYPGDEPSWTWIIDIYETVEDQNFAVVGDIHVTNPIGAPGDMTLNLKDVLNNGTEAAVTCADNASVTVAPGETETCSYSSSPDSASATLNTATGTFNNIDFTAKANVKFVANVLNDKATVSDTEIGLTDREVLDDKQFMADGSDVCSSNWADYDSTTGKYIVSLSNTATLVDEDGTEYKSTASTTYTCEAGTVNLLKLTDGQVNPSMEWQFALYSGPDGFGNTPLAEGTTLNDADGILGLGTPALRPDTTYTICELGVPAGWSGSWQMDVDGDGTYDQTIIPYNPNAGDDPPEDIGNRCVDFGAGTDFPLTVGTKIHFQVDNISSGGAPRTPGYWKNWSSCGGNGNQYDKGTEGDPQNEIWTLDELLYEYDFTIGVLTIGAADCAVAVDILDKRLVADPDQVKDGKKAANDPLHNLATHLLAAQLNFAAGACATPDVIAAADDAQTLLVAYNFDGYGHDALTQGKKDPDADTAYLLANLLDRYNNGEFCGGGLD